MDSMMESGYMMTMHAVIQMLGFIAGFLFYYFNLRPSGTYVLTKKKITSDIILHYKNETLPQFLHELERYRVQPNWWQVGAVSVLFLIGFGVLGSFISMLQYKLTKDNFVVVVHIIWLLSAGVKFCIMVLLSVSGEMGLSYYFLGRVQDAIQKRLPDRHNGDTGPLKKYLVELLESYGGLNA